MTSALACAAIAAPPDSPLHLGAMSDPVDPAQWSEPATFRLVSHGHSLVVLPAGGERLQALLDIIDGAERTLRVCFYIFAADETGRRVRDALLAAQQRGVAVSLLVDFFGSNTTSDAFFAPLREAGACFCWFSPRWNVRYLIRNHQKMVVADEARAMIGGFNVENDYFAPPPAGGWTDLAMTIDGPEVKRLVDW